MRMKTQRFRFRVVALILIALLGLAGFYGLRTVPFSADQPSSSGSLREAVLRLTGQASPSPEPHPEESSAPASNPVPSSEKPPESIPTPDAPSVQPLSEALSDYFASSSPVPEDSTVTETPLN